MKLSNRSSFQDIAWISLLLHTQVSLGSTNRGACGICEILTIGFVVSFFEIYVNYYEKIKISNGYSFQGIVWILLIIHTHLLLGCTVRTVFRMCKIGMLDFLGYQKLL